MKHNVLFISIALLTACANHSPPPDWLITADNAINSHARLWLEGRDKLATGQLAVAREAVSRTGDASQLARIELHACAARLASLQGGECPAFLPLAQDAGQAENVYAAYLAGHFVAVNGKFLPEMQRKALENPNKLKDIGDPLSRLVAAATLLNAGRLSPAGISLAIETAAEQGWRRALLAWLNVEKNRLQENGDQVANEAITRRIARVLGKSD